MIDYDDYEEFGNTHKYLSIDLSTTKHKNRVIDILQFTNPLTQEFEYKIRAQWTADQYHPTMHLSGSELEELADKLNQMVADAKAKKQP
ncbi:hypothetical protein OL330_004682 [Vibrio parahaemolyticus]|uniref:hypothetical protein n=1 Tax=Vibrio TaxID=662 RepID=UPI0004298C0F|nr:MULTISPECIES: hypothetical protein [Vibrio]EKA7375374.1 hypothetical protein [Vibrio parahaemolyticus]ELA9378186.1 hypothetical protein [Vibrio parahaemolyticus]ELK8488287.1 hypothetical protein [Vibrio parahaemolyticus]EMA2438969.1 hypothetical protein [Vibrio parahaemolyticus]MBE3867298.1 hypothetical protein [Vibrio parahaemolyticus]